MFSKQFIVLLLILAGSIGFAGYTFYSPHPCLEPLRYSIGQIDEEFDIATTTLHSILAEAEEPWETAAERDLFVYDPTAEFKVNLLFDERQEFTNESVEVKEELEELQTEREEVLARYRSLSVRYENETEVFEAMQAEYEEELAVYNEEVERWNSQGGAPPAVAEDLQDQQQELEAQRQTLQEKQQEVVSLVDQIDRVVAEERAIVDRYNEAANTYDDRHGESREFEQGHATRNEINVYQFMEHTDLRLVLTHELGHTLGIDHVEDPEAVMNRLMQAQSLDPITLTEADTDALVQACEDASYWLFWN
ncbi:MAG: matrixin family metalloprotease [Candidatus Paceibacterota bacterium]